MTTPQTRSTRSSTATTTTTTPRPTTTTPTTTTPTTTTTTTTTTTPTPTPTHQTPNKPIENKKLLFSCDFENKNFCGLSQDRS